MNKDITLKTLEYFNPNPGCEHKNTIIWEPHMAGARKCTDCKMEYYPNRAISGKNPWICPEPSNDDKIKTMQTRISHLLNALELEVKRHPTHNHGIRAKYAIDLDIEIQNDALARAWK